jgi:hypothetical protein
VTELQDRLTSLSADVWMLVDGICDQVEEALSWAT